MNDNECFKWAVTSAIYTAKNHPERLNKNMRINSEKFNWKGIEFPVSLKQIVKFEKQNTFAVNVLGIEGEKVYPLRISEEREKQFIDLLLISKGETTHYCWVKNKNYQIPKFFPVIFHNLTGYDSHIFVKNLGVSEGLINCIPNNAEKFISFTKDIEVGRFIGKDKKTGEMKEKIVKREIRSIDSFKFMVSSLDKLTANLDEASFQCVNRFFHCQAVDLVRRKGVYPYDYVDSITKLSETKLPPQEQFYSELNHSSISDEDYEHARKVWKYFDMKTMKDYHDLYLKTDVLLLADVFENLRNVCVENYKLHSAWYYTAQGLAWDACLKNTEVRLELLNDVDMLLMIEKGIPGGVSTITKRYAEANNPYMKSYDSNSPNKYISYLDANNLYGWAMSQPLPTHGFKWMSEEELKNWRNNASSSGCEMSRACILEVDLEYPKELHDLHNDYPLAPER